MIKGRLVQMPDPRGRKSYPTMLSNTLLFPLLWLPTWSIRYGTGQHRWATLMQGRTTAICGRSMGGILRGAKASWSLFMTACRSSNILESRKSVRVASQFEVAMSMKRLRSTAILLFYPLHLSSSSPALLRSSFSSSLSSCQPSPLPPCHACKL